jgi:superfamily I DNA/RNA helicase/Zn-dependent peptidase ImmA (M78 family)
MSHWQKIRDAANQLRSEICAAFDLDENELHTAQNLLEKTEEYLELVFVPEHPNSGNLRRALAVLEDDCIYFNNDLKHWYRWFCIAHEVGHFRLHHQSVHCTREEIESFAAADGEANSATEKLVGYGAGMWREREANLFALEMLLPCAALKTAFLEKKMFARQIADLVGMPTEIVAGQLARALLVPVGGDEEKPEKPEKKIELDASQLRAAVEAKCPTLVAAGPGTGKTQTLTHRIAHLIAEGVEPKRILALTFSNKAAEEMRERIAKINAEAAAQIQVMTFHAYGLDILRTFYAEAGLETHSNLLDKIDALLHLENNLHVLDLEHYQRLDEPTANLTAILGAISRAKDELCSPEEYRRQGEKMLAEAEEKDDDELKIKAAKVFETARVYDFYQKFLEKEKLLDFGDLIYRAVRLLRENANVKREVSAKYEAILVDEFQDVNRACGMLLKEIAGCGENLWAVGDLRQSIYRWRGASPANINLFGADFPDAETISLETNYRSRSEIVDLFSRFAEKMKAGGADFFSVWKAKRGAAIEENKTAVFLEIADSIEVEAANIAENIKKYRAEGLRYKDCAIICRTHNQLGKFAKVLSAKGVPIFYLSELFEREEVRDLLALLDLKFSLNGHSLIRVARFAEYKIPLPDARKIIARQKENKQTFAETLSDAEFIEQLSDEGKMGAIKLAKPLSAFSPEISAWSFLANYLFIESEFLKPFFAAEDANNQSRRLAIYQFLKLVQSAEDRFKAEAQPVSAFLNYVKKLAYFNEDKNYAQIPAEAENLDAVRLLTVHSAKGLEFSAVFLPFLGKGKIPAKKQGQTCPNPVEMIAGETDFHDEEEECLFFVAMSRARDFLHLSRANDYSKNHSKFLEILEHFLPSPIHIEHFNDSNEAENSLTPEEIFSPQTFYSTDLDRYQRCGRDYFYTNILGLKAEGDKSVYLKFHSCVYDTLRSMQSFRQLENVELTEENALARLDEFWQAAEVDAHPYAPIYKQKAREIVRRMCGKIENSGSVAEIISPTFEVKIEGAIVRVKLDALEIVENGGEITAQIRKYKTGKSPKKNDPDDAEILMTVAAQANFPEAKAVLHRIYLSDDSVAEVSISAKVIENRLRKYEKAVEGIVKRIFEPSPNDNNCPHCAHFFICPSGNEKP